MVWALIRVPLNAMESEVQLEKNSDAEEEIGDSWEEIDEEVSLKNSC